MNSIGFGRILLVYRIQEYSRQRTDCQFQRKKLFSSSRENNHLISTRDKDYMLVRDSIEYWHQGRSDSNTRDPTVSFTNRNPKGFHRFYWNFSEIRSNSTKNSIESYHRNDFPENLFNCEKSHKSISYICLDLIWFKFHE